MNRFKLNQRIIMEIEQNQINEMLFNSATENRFLNEPVESFKCPQCGLIFIGLPDCHFAFYDANDLNQRTEYNRPKQFKCPKCDYTFPTGFLALENVNDHDTTFDMLKDSQWNWILK